MPDFTAFSLDTLLDFAWSKLQDAAADRRRPMHLVQIGTIGADTRPKVRTVVLRNADRSSRSIRFHTDARSSKAAEIAQSQSVEVHAYDPQDQIQIRISGLAAVNAAPGEEAVSTWNASRPVSRNCYRMEPGPGVPILSGGAYTLPDAGGEPDIGLERFRAVIIAVDAIEVVTLAHKANRRARFEFTGSTVSARWLAP